MPEMSINVRLSPVFEKDNRTGFYIAYFSEFPQAIGSGKDQNEAANNLVDVFKIMVEERDHDIKEQIVEKYMGGIHFNNLNQPLTA